jgi:hypothetical protein
MGRAFEFEIARLAETCRFSSAIPVENLGRFVAEASLRPVVNVGVGGSYSAACFAVSLFESLNWLATAKTTLDFCASSSLLSECSVLLFSGSGRNKDIHSAFENAIAREASSVFCLCARKGSPLRKAADVFWESKFLDFDLPVGKDGFLATNSLLATVLLLAKAFYPNEWTEDAFLRVEEECVSSLQIDAKSAKRKSLLILYGQWSRLAAVDLESKCSEAAIANVQLCDYRNFAHGRHNWLAKRSSETLVIPLITAEDRALALRTLKLLPATTQIYPLETKANGSESAVRLFIRALKLTAALGRVKSIDPGRPGIPPFGSRIYNLRASPAKRFFRATVADCREQAISRKSATGAIRQGLETDVESIIHRLEAETYGAVIFDFDGTLCSSRDRMHGVSAPLQAHLVRLVENGIILGIATGRGKSARVALQSFIPRKLWARVILGYYNGSALGSLDDNTSPDTSLAIDGTITQLAKDLSSLPSFLNICTIEVRPHQITLRSKQQSSWREVSQTVRELISVSFQDARLLESSHSLDIVSTSASKLHVESRIRSSLDKKLSILCIGDRGDINGNDHELLSTPFSLSAHLISPSRDTCWNLAPAGWRCAQATLFYLNCFKIKRDRFRFSLEEGLSWLRRNE